MRIRLLLVVVFLSANLTLGAKAQDAVGAVEWPKYGVVIHRFVAPVGTTVEAGAYLNDKYEVDLLHRLFEESGSVKDLVSAFTGGCTLGDDLLEDQDNPDAAEPCYGGFSFVGIAMREFARGGWDRSIERDRYELNWKDDGTAQITTPALAFDFDQEAVANQEPDGSFTIIVTTTIAGMARAEKMRLPGVPGAPVTPECLVCN